MTPPTAAAAQLAARIADRTATVAVMGLGYVGLPLVRVMHTAGYAVLGVDTDVQKIRMLERGESYLKHLFNVRDGGQCKVRFQILNFQPLMPRRVIDL